MAYLPKGAKVLTVRVQDSAFGHGLMVWAKVDPSAKIESVQFYVISTGEVVPSFAKYIATIETELGEIQHVFQGLTI